MHGLKASSLTTGTVLWATVKFYDTSNRGIHGLTVARHGVMLPASVSTASTATAPVSVLTMEVSHSSH